jgi:hypothetical protein
MRMVIRLGTRMKRLPAGIRSHSGDTWNKQKTGTSIPCQLGLYIFRDTTTAKKGSLALRKFSNGFGRVVSQPIGIFHTVGIIDLHRKI